MNRRTKILATLGPSTDEPGVLKGILDAGVNVVRINFSHGEEKEHLSRVMAVRNYAKENDTYIGILMDLQGPKIRISAFKNDKVELENLSAQSVYQKLLMQKTPYQMYERML